MRATYHCVSCAKGFPREQTVRSVDGKILGCVTGLVIGTASRNVLAMLLFAAAGAMIGDAVDREIAPRCPECAAMLKGLARTYLASQGIG